MATADTFAVRLASGLLVLACSSCKTRAVTRYLQGDKRKRNFCDTCEPSDPRNRAQLIPYPGPLLARAGAIVLAEREQAAKAAAVAPEKAGPAPVPAPSLEQRLAHLEKLLTETRAPVYPDQALLEDLLSELDADTIPDGIRLAKVLHSEIAVTRKELEKVRADRDAAEEKFAKGARLYREVETKLYAAERGLKAANNDVDDLTDKLAEAARTIASRDQTIATLRQNLTAAENEAILALEHVEQLEAAARPAAPAAPAVDEVARVLTGPTVPEPAPERAAVTVASNGRVFEVAAEELTLSARVAAMERKTIAGPVGVSTSGEKAYAALPSHEADRVVRSVERWFAGELRAECLTALLRKVPRYAKGRDLYGVRAGSLWVVAARQGAGYTIIDVVTRGALR